MIDSVKQDAWNRVSSLLKGGERQSGEEVFNLALAMVIQGFGFLCLVKGITGAMAVVQEIMVGLEKDEQAMEVLRKIRESAGL